MHRLLCPTLSLLACFTLPASADSLSGKLLLSSDWCSFHYSEISGSSQQTRIRFSRDGGWQEVGNSESQHSNPYGMIASQSSSENSGRWQVKQGRLWLSTGDAPLRNIDARLRYNSNGYPIINADGVEYSQCE